MEYLPGGRVRVRAGLSHNDDADRISGRKATADNTLRVEFHRNFLHPLRNGHRPRGSPTIRVNKTAAEQDFTGHEGHGGDLAVQPVEAL
jgi:hypothetical protein